MWTGQQLLHDVAVVNLPAAAQPLLLRVQLLVVLNLKHTHIQEVSLTPQQNNAKRFLGGLNRNERDYRPNLSPNPWCRLIPHRDTLDLLLRRTWAVARPRRSRSYRSPWTVGSLEETKRNSDEKQPRLKTKTQVLLVTVIKHVVLILSVHTKISWQWLDRSPWNLVDIRGSWEWIRLTSVISDECFIWTLSKVVEWKFINRT